MSLKLLYPFVTSGNAHHFFVGESTYILRESKVILNFISFMDKIFLIMTNRIALDVQQYYALHVGLYYSPISHKKDAKAHMDKTSFA